MNLLQLVYLLGITNILSLFLVFLSCRCLSGPRLASFLDRFSWYPRFYQSHCLWWWVLAISVLAHTTLAFVVFRNPF